MWDIKKERENNSIMIEKFSDIEEAEIIENYEEKIKVQFEVIMNSLSKAEEVKCYNKENLEILLKVQELLEKIK